MVPNNSFKLFWHLPIALKLFLFTITVPVIADHFFDINPSPSLEASTSLICPTNDPQDCYPALFQPTIHFQKIHPNQALPPGLHVRLDIATGEKEARLNVPEAEDKLKEAIVVVDDVPYTRGIRWQDLETEEIRSAVQLRLQDESDQEAQARPYTPPFPRAASSDPSELAVYEQAVSVLLTESTPGTVSDDIEGALETLIDLSHDLTWGLTISRDVGLRSRLLDMIMPVPDGLPQECDPGLRPAALLLVGTAIQNNRDALVALLSHEYGAHGGSDPLHATLASLSFDSNDECDPILISRSIFLLSQLCADDRLLSELINSFSMIYGKGLPQLQRLFSASLSTGLELAGQQKIRHRIANFVGDHAERMALLLTHDAKGSQVGLDKLRTVLQPWCGTLTIAIRSLDEASLDGVSEAKREVDNVLKNYTGEGCGVDVEWNRSQEL